MSVDLEAWAAWSPPELAGRLAGVTCRWAVAGGWALELHAGRTIRAHEDVEIAVSREDFATVSDALTELRWFAAGDGSVAALEPNPNERLAHTWQTWGWDLDAHCWRVDVMRETWSDGDWVYRRRPAVRMPLERAILTSPAGIPYLTPEIVLLFKAKRRRAKDELDLSATLPLLSSAQRNWLATAVGEEMPKHPWLARLR